MAAYGSAREHVAGQERMLGWLRFKWLDLRYQKRGADGCGSKNDRKSLWSEDVVKITIFLHCICAHLALLPGSGIPELFVFKLGLPDSSAKSFIIIFRRNISAALTVVREEVEGFIVSPVVRPIVSSTANPYQARNFGRKMITRTQNSFPQKRCTAEIISGDKDEQVPHQDSRNVRKGIARALALAYANQSLIILVCRHDRTNKIERVCNFPDDKDGVTTASTPKIPVHLFDMK